MSEDKPRASEFLESVSKLRKDIRDAERISVHEARFLVDDYYLVQEYRKRVENQLRSFGRDPHAIIEWLLKQNNVLETELKKALGSFADDHPVGVWMQSITGIGPVIAAGMLAHIDIEKANTAGHIYRFAGLDPDVKWEKKTKRPWNAALKTLCWKVGQSFMKFSNNEQCVYGHMYRERKAYEQERNERGGNAETAKAELERKNWGKGTDAYKHLTGTCKAPCGIHGPHLPPAQIDARARRWAVKIFLSHLQQVWYFQHYGVHGPRPFAIERLGHVDIIAPPNTHLIKGFDEPGPPKVTRYDRPTYYQKPASVNGSTEPSKP